MVCQNELIKNGLHKEKEDEKDKEKDGEEKPKTFPQEDIEKMLKSINLAECIPLLAEKEISEPDVFFELGADTLIGLLDIKTEGKKYRFKKKMQEIIKKHDKVEALKEQDDICEVVEQAFEMLQKKNSVIF